MASKKRKPQWWQIYAMLPVLAGAFLLEMRLPFTSTEHIIAQLGLLFLVYAYIQSWMRKNRTAMMNEDENTGQWVFNVYEFPPADVIDAEPRPLLQLPEAGIKGVLSTTFEMEQPPDEPAYPVGADIFYAEKAPPIRNTSNAKAREMTGVRKSARKG